MDAVDLPNVQEDNIPLTPSGKKGKISKKQLPTPAPTPGRTRSSKRLAEETLAEDHAGSAAGPATPSPSKKKKISVTGTLGQGEGMAHIHPSSQATFEKSQARNASRSSSSAMDLEMGSPSPQQVAGPSVPALGGLATATQAPDGRMRLDVTTEQYEALRQLFMASPQMGLLPSASVTDKAIPSPNPGKLDRDNLEPQTPKRSVLGLRKAPDSISPFPAARNGQGGSLAVNVKNDNIPKTPTQPQRSEGSNVVTPRASAAATGYDRHGQRIPAVCEVTDPAIQDPAFSDHYPDLPRLRRCKTSAIDGEVPTQYFMPSQWIVRIPDIDEDTLLAAITFTEVGRNVNLARIDPDHLTFKQVVNSNKMRRDLCVGDQMALCLTPIYVVLSNVESQSSVGQKRVIGVPHCQEANRFTGTLGMAFNVAELRCHFFKNGFSFTTYGDNATFTTGPGFAGMPSGMEGGSSRPPAPTKLTTLRGTDPVYVFDLRKSSGWESLDFEHLMVTLDSMDSSLSIQQKMAELDVDLFEGEIPVGSCAVVAHTVNVSRPNKKVGNYSQAFALNLNIQYVFLLGTPPDEGDDEEYYE